MNPELLLGQFDRISDAPDAIPRLRTFVLDLAVRGKVVQQDPSDEPASELLERICSEKMQLMKDGKIRKQAAQQHIGPETIPFSLPNKWIWARLGDVIHLVSGQHLQPGEYSEQKDGGLPYITGPADFGRNGLVITRQAIVKKATAKAGQILLTVKGAGVGKTAVCDLPEVAISRQLMAITAIGWSQKFLLLTTHRLATALIESARSLIPGISREDVDRFVFPLPPLAEQNRIVAKVDELMDLCDRLETAKAERESRRDRLAAASHHHLNNSANAGAFHDYSNFYITHLQSLISRPDHIKELRQTILNFAVRGFLVPQDPNAEFAAHMLGNRQLFLDSDAQPWKLPCGWAWSSFNLIGETLGGGTPSKADLEFWEGSIPWVSPKDMKVDTITDTQDHISEAAIEQSAARMIPTGSLLMVVRGMILAHSFPTALTAVPVTINQDMKAIVPFRPDLIRFLALLTKGLKPEVLRLVLRSTHGTCKLLTDDLFSLPIPIPPLAEQFRIVTRVDELMTLCDGLETQLTTAQTETSRLLEAVLHNALSDNSRLEELVKSAALK